MVFEILKECFLRMYHVLPALPAERVNALYMLAGLMIAGLLAAILLRVRKAVRFLPAAVSLLTASAVLVICIFYPGLELLYAHPAGNPAEKTDAFLAAVNEGRIADAYGILSGSDVTENSERREHRRYSVMIRPQCTTASLRRTSDANIRER